MRIHPLALRASVILASIVAWLAPIESQAASYPLNQGTKLAQGQSLTLGDLLLTMQTDGNLCLRQSVGKALNELWCAQPSCAQSGSCGTGFEMVFQEDGNLALYNNQGYYWGSGPIIPSDGPVSASTVLVLSDTAPYLQIMDGTSTLWTGANSFSAPLFLYSGNILHSGDLYLTLQSDGNLCLRRKIDNAGHQSGLYCMQVLPTPSGLGPGLHMAFQSDGNLALYDNTYKYYAGTGPNPPSSRLMLSESSPYLSIASASGQTLWPAPPTAPSALTPVPLTLNFPVIAPVQPASAPIYPAVQLVDFKPYFNGMFPGTYTNHNPSIGEPVPVDHLVNADGQGTPTQTKVLASMDIAINAADPSTGHSYGIQNAGIDLCLDVIYPDMSSGTPGTAPPPGTQYEALCMNQFMSHGQWPRASVHVDFTHPVAGGPATQGLLVPPEATVVCSPEFTVRSFAHGVTPTVIEHLYPGTGPGTGNVPFRVGSMFSCTLNLANYNPAIAASTPAVESVRIPQIDTEFYGASSLGAPGTPAIGQSNLTNVPLRTFGQWVYSPTSTLYFKGTQDNGNAAESQAIRYNAGEGLSPGDTASSASFFPWNITLSAPTGSLAGDSMTSYCTAPGTNGKGKICAFYTLLEVPDPDGIQNPAPLLPGQTVTPLSAQNYCKAATGYNGPKATRQPFSVNDPYYHDSTPKSSDGYQSCLNYLLQAP